MKQKSIFLCLTALLLQLAAQAQTYTRGSIELQNGETKQGWIYYEPWLKTPKKIRFSADSINHTTYRVEDLKLLDIPGNDRYRTAMAKVRKEGKGITDVQDSLVMDTVLLHVLMDGSDFSLYELEDDSMRYFVKRAGRETLELDPAEFRKQLAVYHPEDFSETQAYFDYLEKLKFTEEDLMDATKRINEKYAGGKLLYTVNNNNQVRPKGNWLIGGGGGIARSNKTSRLTSLAEVMGVGKGSELYLTAGRDFPITRNVYGPFWRLELEFSSFDYRADRNDVGQANRVTYTSYGVSITPGASIFTYLFHNNKSGAYLGAGAHYHSTFYKKNTLQAYYSGYSTHYDELVKTEHFWVNASLQLGYIYHKQWELSAWTYVIGRSMPSVDTHFYAVGVYYHFGGGLAPRRN